MPHHNKGMDIHMTPTRTVVLLAFAALLAAPMAHAASIKGEVKFEGEKRRQRPIRMDADRTCVEAHEDRVFDERYTHAENGNLVNVLVYVAKGAEKSETPPAEVHVIDQKGCMYIPHVSACVVGQKVDILNGDKAMHNVNCKPKKNSAFNSMMAPGTKMEKTFAKEEMEIPFKCDVHPWMGSYLHVMENPYFAVSDKDGKFEIKGLPAGEYELRFWYESSRYEPIKDKIKVTVTADEAKTVDVTYQPKSK